MCEKEVAPQIAECIGLAQFLVVFMIFEKLRVKYRKTQGQKLKNSGFSRFRDFVGLRKVCKKKPGVYVGSFDVEARNIDF